MTTDHDGPMSNPYRPDPAMACPRCCHGNRYEHAQWCEWGKTVTITERWRLDDPMCPFVIVPWFFMSEAPHCAADECEDAYETCCHLEPLDPAGSEAPLLSEGFLHPDEDTSLARPACCKLCSDKGAGDEEHHDCKDIEEHCLPTDYPVCREVTYGQYCGSGDH